MRSAVTNENEQKCEFCAIFYENAYNGLKRMQTKFKTILSNLKFYARVNARTKVYAHFCAPFIDREIDRIDIDLVHDKYE